MCQELDPNQCSDSSNLSGKQSNDCSEADGVVVNGVESGYCAPPFGCFLKDYFISEW